MSSTYHPSQSGLDNLSVRTQVASRSQRFWTFILDFVFMYIFGYFFGVFLVLIGQTEFVIETNQLIMGAIILLLYYVPQEALFSRTLGKWIAGTKVVNEDGDRPSLIQVVIRTLSRMIPFEAFSFLGEDPVGWHDSIPKTMVITVRSR